MSSTSLHLQLRNARRSMGLTQMELARRVDCTQSAVSMMEGGQMSAIARPTLEKIASLLGVELPPEAAPEAVAAPAAMPVPESVVRICPNADCPGNLPFRVGGEVLFLPRAHAVHGNRCPICGEVLVATCPECGAPLHAGAACCTECGAPLVPAALDPAIATDAWIKSRQQQSSMLLAWNA